MYTAGPCAAGYSRACGKESVIARGKDRHATVCIRMHRTGGSSCVVAPGSHLVLAWRHRCCERKMLFSFFCPVARRYACLLSSY